MTRSALHRSFTAPTALEIVRQTEAIRWLIDEWIADGKTDDEIVAGLPVAVAVIRGDISPAELLEAAVSSSRRRPS